MNGLRWPESARAVFPRITESDLAEVRSRKDASFASELRLHPGKVDKVACSLVMAFMKAWFEIWLVTAGSKHATHLKLAALPTLVQAAFAQVKTGVDKTGDRFYWDLNAYSGDYWPMMLVDDDPRVWKAAREKLDGISVVEWGS